MQTIEKELLARLENGIYDGIYNLPFNKFIETLDTDELQAEDENEEVCFMLHIFVYNLSFFAFPFFLTEYFLGISRNLKLNMLRATLNLKRKMI